MYLLRTIVQVQLNACLKELQNRTLWSLNNYNFSLYINSKMRDTMQYSETIGAA